MKGEYVANFDSKFVAILLDRIRETMSFLRCFLFILF